MTHPAAMDPPESPRTVLFVAGTGRSGTSTMAVLMQLLGLHVPQPEVAADASNPKGFGEPRWVVDLHDRLLRRVLVQFNDARPGAWVEAATATADDVEQRAAADWLAGHLADHPELVVKDPRLGWFLGLWREAAARSAARPVFATMLRPPAEVVGSKQTYYDAPLGPTQLTAGWLNMMLHTERATRPVAPGEARVFVRYADLLADWRRTTTSVAQRLDLRAVLGADDERLRAADAFVDPALRRVTHGLADLDLPPRLHELTAETWTQLDRLAEPDGDLPAVHAVLDDLRAAYVDLYAEAEAISRSSAIAAEHQTRRRLTTAAAAAAGTGTGTGAGAGRAADRVPHRLRALVPPSVRRGLRRVAGRPR